MDVLFILDFFLTLILLKKIAFKLDMRVEAGEWFGPRNLRLA